MCYLYIYIKTLYTLPFVRFIFIEREREREREREMEGDKGKVCVTGGTGFLASWLIMRLLEHGYSVHTTIRPDPGELLFLFSLSTQLR
jgi:UDP-N-acetylmuramyl pentapeptide phosphotransferase/UDP-N-acetylglucosamine-1-phosphate transferase